MNHDPRTAAAPSHARRSRTATHLLGASLALALALAAAGPRVLAQTAKPAEKPSVPAEFGKPIEAAIAAIKRKNGKEALAHAAEAEAAVKNRTPYENYLLDRIRGEALQLEHNPRGAAQAFERASASPAISGAERLPLLAAAMSQYYTAKDYAKTVALADRYARDGGTDKAVRTLLIQALYLGGDLARAAREIAADVHAEEQAGKAPSENQLQFLANVTLKQRDAAGYAASLDKLLTYYPKRDYWLAAIHSLQTRSHFPGRLTLDLARFKLAIGTLRSANDYVEAAQLSLQDGLPAEASKFIAQGYAAQMLGKGPDAARQARLKAMAARDLAEDRRTRKQTDIEAAAAKDGTALFNSGLSRVLDGDHDTGLEMMERGLRKGGMKHAADARLRLGYAYYVAGRYPKAIQAFKAVRGGNGAGGLARLWILHIEDLERKAGAARGKRG